MLRDLWGEERFGEVIRAFVERWNGKHPTPWDFFNTLEDISGEDLDWLIRPWFFEYGTPDLALGEVLLDGDTYRIEVARVGANPVPVHLTIIWADDTETVLQQSVTVWAAGAETYSLAVPARGDIKAILLGNDITPDAESVRQSVSGDGALTACGRIRKAGNVERCMFGRRSMPRFCVRSALTWSRKANPGELTVRLPDRHLGFVALVLRCRQLRVRSVVLHGRHVTLAGSVLHHVPAADQALPHADRPQSGEQYSRREEPPHPHVL